MLTIPNHTKPENTMITQDFIPTLVIGIGVTGAFFTPTLVIGIGATGAFFTLRQTYQSFGGVIRSYHLFNLSQDADAAISKAKEYSETSGTPLWVSEDRMKSQLRDIIRATAEQRQALLDKQARDEAARAAEIEAQKQQLRDMLARGVFAFGQYYGRPIVEATRGYLTWLADNVETFESESIVRQTAEIIIAEYSHLLFPKPISAWVGELGKRQSFLGTVTRVSHYTRPAFSGFGEEIVFVTTIVLDSLECLVCFSTAFNPDAGDEIAFKATVKEHSEYKGLKQTIVQRVAVTGNLTKLKEAL